MNTKNLKPFDLKLKTVNDDISLPIDVVSLIKTGLVDDIFTSKININSNVVIDKYDNNSLSELITTYLYDDVGKGQANFVNVEKELHDLCEKSYNDFDKNLNLPYEKIFISIASAKENLDLPSDTIIYTPATDIIPACKDFLSGKKSYDYLLATFNHYIQPNDLLGVFFSTESVFDEFKVFLKTEITNISANLNDNVKKMFDEFDKIKLNKIQEGLKLRNSITEGNNEYSFARVLMNNLNKFIAVNSNICNFLPFDLENLFLPKNIVFINIEETSKATPKKINNEWNLVKKSLKFKVKMINNNKLNNLTTYVRSLSKMIGSAELNNERAKLNKSLKIKFSKNKPLEKDVAQIIMKIINKMMSVNKSMNIFKKTKMSFKKPNRRNPDDFNKQGKITSITYKPDLHLYIDTSGSISEYEYQMAVKACIKIAKKLNINMYFNSFSHFLSQTTKLNLENKGISQIYKEFQKVTKVSGGTDFSNVWEFINNSKNRKKELSIMITDFEYYPNNNNYKHPDNLYYLPIYSKSQGDYERIVKSAENYLRSMKFIKKDLRRNILF